MSFFATEPDNEDSALFRLRLLCPAHGLMRVTFQVKLDHGRKYRPDYKYRLRCGCSRQKDIATCTPGIMDPLI